MNSFTKLFKANEAKEFAGRKNIGIWILSSILLLTFIAIGHAVGGLNDLQKRMDNPFTNWVNLPLTGADSREAVKVVSYFDKKEVCDEFSIDRVSGYNKYWEKVRHFENNSIIELKSRCVDPGEKLLDVVLESQNVQINNNHKLNLNNTDKEAWVILRTGALSNIGMNIISIDSLNFLPISVSWNLDVSQDAKYMQFFIPILAVVDELPDRVDMIMPFHLQELMRSDFSETRAVNIEKTNNLQFLTRKIESGKIDEVNSMINMNARILDHDEKHLLINGASYQHHEYYLDTSFTFMEVNQLLHNLQGTFSFISRFDQLNIKTAHTFQLTRPHYITFNFNSLENVKDLKDLVQEKFQMEISMNQVKDKENFSKVTILTYTLSIMLILFSIISIIIFLYNTLKNHLQKIKMNLGTLKAFGLKDKVVISIYSKIINQYFLKSSFYAFLISLGYLLINKYLLNKNHFDLFNVQIILAWILILIFINIISNKLLKETLLKSPGDLIYNRN